MSLTQQAKNSFHNVKNVLVQIFGPVNDPLMNHLSGKQGFQL